MSDHYFKNLPSHEKNWALDQVSGKKIRLTYDYSDAPGGAIGPVDFVGKITRVGALSILFAFADKNKVAQLTIEGIEDYEVIEWSFTKKTKG